MNQVEQKKWISRVCKIVLASSLIFSIELSAEKSRTVGDILKKISKGSEKKATKLQFNSRVEVSNEAKKRNLKAIQPPSEKSMARVSSGEISRLEEVVDKSIQQMYRLIQKYKNSVNRGELWLRQGELYVEKARLVEQRIFNEYDRQSELYQAKKIKKKPKVDLRPAWQYYKKAETLYEWFIRDFQKDPKMDQALFFMGYINFELNRQTKGQHYYNLLTSKFPRSNYVNEAHFALGEYYFEQEDWNKALTEYTYVMKDSSSRLNAFAHYKSAWCLYRTGKYSNAVKNLEKVILDARRSSGEKKERESKLRLATEALRDIVLFYANSGDYKSAESYFAKLGGKSSYLKMLENLAYLYSSQGALEKARYVFKRLIAKKTFSEEAYQYQKQIVLNYSNAGDKTKYRKELLEWVRDYAKGGSWYRANSGNQELIKEAETTKEKLLRVHTLKWHQNYQNTRSTNARNESIAGYRIYFEYFPEAEMAHEMHFYYGELLFELGKYADAGLQYQRSVELAKEGNNKFLKKASLNRLISMEKDLPNVETLEAKAGQSVQPVSMPPEVRSFVLAGQDHIKRFPGEKESLEVKFRLARIYYIYNHYDPAELLFKDIVKTAPRSKYAEYSANLLLDIYNVRQDYAGMAKVGNELLAVKGFENKQLFNDIHNIVEKAAFNQAQVYEKNKSYGKAAKSFLGFAQEYPNSSLSTSALYNAGVNYERAGLILQAIPIYEKVKRDRNPQNAEIRKKSILLQANLYEKTGDLERAAYLYEDYADQYTKEGVRADLYYNAATIFAGARKQSKAIDNYLKFYSLRKTTREGHEAMFKVAKEYEAKKDLKNALKYYSSYLDIASKKTDDYAEASYKMGEIYESLGPKSKATSWYKNTANNVSGKGKRNYYKAAAKLKLALEDYQQYASIVLPKNKSKQEAVMQNKLQKLDRLNKSFADIIQLDSGEQVISSLIWAGKAYEHMGSSILNAFTQEEREKHKVEIGKIVDPMLQASTNYFEKAVSKSFELDLYSRDISIAFEKLSKLKPAQYPYWEMIQMPLQVINQAGGQ